MSYFSLLIKKYYRKEKGQIVFTNGMNLNQLAIAMWETMGAIFKFYHENY